MAHKHANPIKQVNLATTSGKVTVAITSTPIVPENRARAEITIVNIGTTAVNLAFATAEANDGQGVLQPVAPTAVVGQGVQLAPGASWTSNAYTGPIAGIATTSPDDVTVAEF